MKCLFCGKELSTPYWVGPKKLGMHYCDYDCYIQNFMQKYPEVFSGGTRERILKLIKG